MIGTTTKLYMPVSVPQITRGEAGEEEHYFAERDGSITVRTSDVDDFLAMGCTTEPQSAPVVVNHVDPEAQQGQLTAGGS